MKKYINLFAIGVMLLYFVVSLIFRERNLYTQSAWVLFVLTLAMHTGFQFKNQLELKNQTAGMKHFAWFVLLALFYTILLIFGLGGAEMIG